MKAIFAGTFDPFTLGHLDIVNRAAKVFDFVHISILYNPGKDGELFTVSEREDLIRDAVSGIENVDVMSFDGLLTEHAKQLGAGCIIRGIRNGSDVDYESMLEQVNNRLAPEIQTLYMISDPKLAYISSSLVRQLISIGIDISELVPNAAHQAYRNHNILAERK